MENNLFPGHPPEDYTGTVANWIITLQAKGYWDGEGWYGDITLTDGQYQEMLEECEE